MYVLSPPFLRTNLSSHFQGQTANPLLFWAKNRLKYPALARLARCYLAIPATSTQCERVWSHAGNIVSAKRCAMRPGTIEKMIFLYENKDLF